MADIEMIIKIPEEEYNICLSHSKSLENSIRIHKCFSLEYAVIKGTPLNDVLDKIRAEIKQDYEDLDAYEKYDLDALPSFMVRVFGIFDKYRKEQTEE